MKDTWNNLFPIKFYEMKPRKCKISNISKPWISVCIVIAKFIMRQNLTSACSQEATAVVKW